MEPSTAQLLLELAKPMGAFAIALAVLVWRLRIADKSQEAFMSALKEHGEIERIGAAAHKQSLDDLIAELRRGRR